jgi:hypothetical protein
MEALLSIVESGRIRATHIRYLNDWSEAEIIWKLVLRRLAERKDASKSAEERRHLEEIIVLGNNRRIASEFVTSFSEDGDDLSQWRAYSPSQAGFSIGFSSDALRTQWVIPPGTGDPSFVGGQLLPVSYLSKTNVAEIDRVIDDAFDVGGLLHGQSGFHGPISGKDAILAWFSTIAPGYKDVAFAAEKEWRMVLSKPHKPMPGQRFRAGKSTIVPYIEVELNRGIDSKPVDAYMIREVVVGPTPNPDLSVESLKSLFSSKGRVEVLFKKSAIPYRHW